ncbi:MAG: hypothetical protein ACR2KT_16500 [Methylocella sp.]|nr:MAG: hypothetical protein DLM68_11090 [Hyphomicrobiales bacterium]
MQDANGQTLSTYHFDARIDDGSGSLVFRELVPWKAGTNQIILKRGITPVAKRSVSGSSPTLKVLRPRDGETWGAKATVSWRGADADGDALTYTVLFNSGDDQRWVTLASGLTRQSVTIDPALLAGSQKAGIKLRASDGVNTTEAYSAGAFIVPDHPPVVSILGAARGRLLRRQSAEFTGAAYDPKYGMLPASNLIWTSNRDGTLGAGGHIKTTKPLSSGAHVITLTATNSRGLTNSRSVNIVVQ